MGSMFPFFSKENIMFQLQELDLIKAAVDKLDHWEIVMPSATDDDELQFELTPSVSLSNGP